MPIIHRFDLDDNNSTKSRFRHSLEQHLMRLRNILIIQDGPQKVQQRHLFDEKKKTSRLSIELVDFIVNEPILSNIDLQTDWSNAYNFKLNYQCINMHYKFTIKIIIIELGIYEEIEYWNEKKRLTKKIIVLYEKKKSLTSHFPVEYAFNQPI